MIPWDQDVSALLDARPVFAELSVLLDSRHPGLTLLVEGLEWDLLAVLQLEQGEHDMVDGVGIGVCLPRNESAVGLSQRDEQVHVFFQLEEVLWVGRPPLVVLRLVRDGSSS